MLENDATSSDKSPKAHEMSDAAIALGLIEEVWPLKTTPRKIVIGAAFNAVKQIERGVRKHVERPRAWTERRIRSIVDGEARRIDNYEIDDLTAMVLQEARIELARSKARAARLEAFIAAPMAAQTSQALRGLRERNGRVDGPGTDPRTD